MANSGTILFNIVANTSGATAAINGLQSQVAGLGKSFGSSIVPVISLNQVFSSVVGNLQSLVGGFVSLIQHSAEAGNELFVASQKTGFFVETLSALKNVGDGENVSLGQITTALGFFDKNMGLAEEGSKKMIAIFGALKISTKDNETALRDAFRAINSLRTEHDKTTAAMQLFSKGGVAMNAIIKESHGNLDEAIKKFKDFGTLVSTEDARAAHDFTLELKTLNQSVDSLGRTLLTTLSPSLTAITGELLILVQVLAEVAKYAAMGLESMLGLSIPKIPGLEEGVQGIMAMEGFVQGKPKDGGASLPNLAKGGSADKARRDQLRVYEQQSRELQRQLKNDTENLKREYDQQIINLQSFTDETIGLINTYYDKRRAVLLQKQAIAKTGSEKEKAGDELTALDDQRHGDVMKALENQAKEQLQVKRQLQEDTLKLQDDFDTRSINNIRARIQTEQDTEVEGERQVAEIERQAFKRRWDDLVAQREELRKKARDLGEAENNQQVILLDAQIYVIEQAEKTAEEERERRIAAAEQRRVDLHEKADAEIRALQERANQNSRDLDRQMYEFTLNSPYSSLGARRAAIAKLTELDLEESDIRHRHNLKLLDDEEVQAQKEIKSFEDKEKRKQEIHEHYQALRDQEDERHNNERNQRQQAGDQDIRSSTFPRGLNPFGDAGMQEFTKSGDILKATFSDIKQSGLDAFGALAEGFGQMVGAWASGADLGDHAIRKMIGSVLAGLAAQAATQALMFTAYGLAALTPWGAAIYGPAAPWFEAAALMGAVALTAAVVGRAISPQQRTNAATGATSSAPSGGPSSPQPIVAGRTTGGGNSRTDVVLEKLAKAVDRLTAVSPGQVLMTGAQQAPHAIPNALRDDFRLNGITRGMIVDQRA